MFASFVFASLLAAQVVFVPQPRSAPPPAPESEYFQRNLDRLRADLAEKCMSPEGIEIVVDAFTERARRSAAEPQAWRVHEEAVAQAAWAQPFDAQRFESAVWARARFRAEREIEMAASSLETFAKLSPADQEIHAHRMTTEVARDYKKPC